MQEIKKLTGSEKENAIQEKAREIAHRVLFFECSQTVKALARDSENNWKDSPIDLEAFYTAHDSCPNCGETSIEHRDGTDGNGWLFCSACGETFDDPSCLEVCQYWFFDRNYLADFKEYGAPIVETEDAPIWLRSGCGYGWELEGVFRFIAQKELKLAGIID